MVSLWIVTGILLYLAFVRLLHSDYHIEGGAMLLTASIAVCANLLYVLDEATAQHLGLQARALPYRVASCPSSQTDADPLLGV